MLNSNRTNSEGSLQYYSKLFYPPCLPLKLCKGDSFQPYCIAVPIKANTSQAVLCFSVVFFFLINFDLGKVWEGHIPVTQGHLCVHLRDWNCERL